MEALACGLVPVIANSPLSATPQFALDDRSLFQAGNAGDLADKIDYWIEHPEERAAQGPGLRRPGGRDAGGRLRGPGRGHVPGSHPRLPLSWLQAAQAGPAAPPDPPRSGQGEPTVLSRLGAEKDGVRGGDQFSDPSAAVHRRVVLRPGGWKGRAASAGNTGRGR